MTRVRLYLETMEKVLSRSAKILLDADSGNNLLYLPLGELREGAALTPPPLNLTPELQQGSSSESQTDTRNRGRSAREGDRKSVVEGTRAGRGGRPQTGV